MSNWTSEMVNNLRSLWEEGMPTAKIGELLGKNKNQVIGKAHLLGLPRHARSTLNMGNILPKGSKILSKTVQKRSGDPYRLCTKTPKPTGLFVQKN